MRQSSVDRYTNGPSAAASLPDRVCVEFLQAHEHASLDGRPLLTDGGVRYLRQRLLRTDTGRAAADRPLAPLAVPPGPVPHWDAETRRLWFGDQLLLRFRQPAPHQTRLLQALEEQHWIDGHIDDPLLRMESESDEDAKRRLHDTIKNLNRRLPAGTIRFRGDGTGQGVRWEYDQAISEASRAP